MTDEQLPVDPDLGRRPVHVRPGSLGLVALGGAVGTALRALITRAGSAALATPYVTMIINLVGAFLLGLLLEQLARRGPDVGRRRRLRLLLGTGGLGGFTTYSSLSVDLASSGIGRAVLVGAITLLGGLIMTTLGLLVAGRTVRP